jgi:hypothetical protein
MSKFDWLRKIVNWFKEPTYEKVIVPPTPAGPEPPTPQPETIEKRLDEAVKQTRVPIQKGIVQSVHVGAVRNELEKIREEQIRTEFLPTPKTRRISHPRSCQPPAEQHRDAISKFMKGKASSRYLRTIKQSPKIKIDSEVDG